MSCGNCTNCSNKCDVCVDCDSSNKQCDTQQSFCTGTREKGQLASVYIGAAEAPNFVRDDIIFKKFPQATLNQLIDYVIKAGLKGEETNSIALNIPHETRPHIYADKINELIAGIKSVSAANTPGPEKEKEKVIYAAEFNTIMNSINNLKVGTGACDICVSSCNIACNTCNNCITCISCNTCQGVVSYSSHYSSS